MDHTVGVEGGWHPLIGVLSQRVSGLIRVHFGAEFDPVVSACKAPPVRDGNDGFLITARHFDTKILREVVPVIHRKDGEGFLIGRIATDTRLHEFEHRYPLFVLDEGLFIPNLLVILLIQRGSMGCGMSAEVTLPQSLAPASQGGNETHKPPVVGKREGV
jgi:hypothetical protein